MVTRYNLGQHAVNLFFILSGIMVAGSLDRAGTLIDFAVARILRIGPGLVTCVLLTAFALGPTLTTLSPSDYFADARVYRYAAETLALKASATLPGVLESVPVPQVLNVPLWTLKFEVLCYALLGLASGLGAWRSNRLFLALVVASVAVCVPITLVPRPALLADVPFSAHIARFWLCFLLGVSCYRWREHLPLSWTVLAAIAGVWVLFGRHTSLEPALSFLTVGYGAVLVASLPTGPVRRWTNDTDLSYGVYIYGWPTAQALVWAEPGMAIATLIIASLAGSLALSWLSWTLIEKPSLRARKYIGTYLGAGFDPHVLRHPTQPL